MLERPLSHYWTSPLSMKYDYTMYAITAMYNVAYM